MATSPWVVRLIWLLPAMAYAILMIRWHDHFQAPALRWQGKLGMPLWHWGILILLVLLVLGVFWGVRHQDRLRQGLMAQRWTVLVVAFGMVAGNAFLMVNSVEAIHYFQYGLLTLLLVPVFGAVAPAVMLSILFGVVDEWYQMMVLHPGWQGYLDFNDLVLNALGATAGGLVARCWRADPEPVSWWWGWCGLALLVLLVFQTDMLGVTPEGGQWAIVRWGGPNPGTFLSRWIDTGWGNHWFMLSWLESLALVWGLPWLLRLPCGQQPGRSPDGNPIPDQEPHE